MRSLVRLLVLTSCLLCALFSASTAATPTRISVQGVLRDSFDNPVPDGNHALILSGWDDSTGGNLLWIENKVVSTHLGTFQSFLETPASSSILSKSGPQYLQVQKSGEAPMTPRLPIVSVPFALKSSRMDGDIITRPSAIHITNPGSGDPDFDLLRIKADSTGSSVHLSGGDPDFDLLRVSAAASTGSITVGSGDPDFDLLRITGSPAASSLVLNPGSGDPDFDLLRIVADNSGGSIAIDEEGVQRMHMTGGNGAAKLSLNGLPPGSPVGGLITMEADSTGGGIAIEEEGVQVVRMQSGTSGGGGGGGSIAIGEEGVQIVRIASDSTGSTLSVESGGVPGAVLTVSPSKKKYNYFEAWPCGVRDVEIGTEGVTMSCTPGGSTTPDTAVQIDPEGHMTLAGDLSVGGDICAVGTIGACSDARYKTDVAALEGALAMLSSIRGVNFNWRVSEFPDKDFRSDRDLGFIAQELKEVVPQVVTLGKDGYYSVDYGRLTPLLVEAVKELDAKTRRIAELEARLSALEDLRESEQSTLALRLERLESLVAATGAESSGASAKK